MKVDSKLVHMAWRMYQAFNLNRRDMIRFVSDFLEVDVSIIRNMFDSFEAVGKETQFPEVLEVMRQAMLDKAYATKDEDLFRRLTSPGWERFVIDMRADELSDPVRLRRLEAYEIGETLLPWQEEAVRNRGIQIPTEQTARANTGLGGARKEPERIVQTERPVPKHNTPPCPLCGKPTVKRSGRYGEFYGCSTYPACRGTVNIT